MSNFNEELSEKDLLIKSLRDLEKKTKEKSFNKSVANKLNAIENNKTVTK